MFDQRIFDIVPSLINEKKVKIVLFVIDGLGGINRSGKTELEMANTPNMNRIAKISSLGMIIPVLPGITPGSGPAHLSLFGYDPLKWDIGRGVLSALGVDLELKKGDVAARGNFATVDRNGLIADRRAGRIPDEECARLCEKLNSSLKEISKIKIGFYPEKEHRFVLLLRGKNLSPFLSDTDPQKTGVPPLKTKALRKGAETTVRIVNTIVEKALKVLSDEPKANSILLRGFSSVPDIPHFSSIFKLKACAIAEYPMYRGLARLLGMEVMKKPSSPEDIISLLKENYENYDFFYIHFKKADSYGEDGNFEEKVKAIEKADYIAGEIFNLAPDVLVITGDHSTPSELKSHSWHPVPLLLYAESARMDGFEKFSEMNARCGSLGIFPSVYLMPLILAHAGKLQKFGA